MLPVIYFILGVLATVLVGYPLLRQRAPKAEAPAAEGEVAASPAPTVFTGRNMAIAGVGVVVAASAAIYFLTNDTPSPDAAPSAAMAPAGAQAGAAGLPDVDTMIQRLAKRLEEKPNDPEGWRMLGWSYFATQHYSDAAKAYGRAVALKPKDAGFQSAYGEALVKAAGDKVTPEASAAFGKALAADPSDTRAKVYKAREKAQSGQASAALDDLFGLLGQAAPNAPMASTIRDAIHKVAGDAHIDVSKRLPAEPAAQPGPSAADVAAAQAMPAQDRQAMIDGMVAKLEARLTASPKDADGWIMLIRSRRQLGQEDQASAALKKGLAAFADDPAARAKISAAAAELGVR